MKSIYIFYCLLYATWTEGADIHVVGFEGGVLTFQCSHSNAKKNNKYFCKDPCKTNGDILVTVKSGERAQAERITLVDSGNGVFSVIFNPLHLSDAGRYWCAVERTFLDTYTTVYLTVKEAVANDPTTVLDVSSTWMYHNISSSTPLISQMDTSINSSIASNSTDGGKNSISTAIVLYATAGAVTMLTVLVLAVSLRKCRKKQKQQRVCSNSTDHLGDREVNCEHGETGEEVQFIKNVSERFSSTHHPKQDQPTSTSTAADCSVPFHIYENICCAKDATSSRCSPRNIQDKQDASPAIYTKPLPPIILQKPGKHTNKESCTNKVSTCPARSCCDSAESRPGSLWFGLDLSGTI